MRHCSIWNSGCKTVGSGARDTVIRLKIREVAQAKKISRTRLSRLADTNYKTINALWNDPYREVTTTTLDKIAKALGVPVTDLLEQVPDQDLEGT